MPLCPEWSGIQGVAFVITSGVDHLTKTKDCSPGRGEKLESGEEWIVVVPEDVQ